MLSINIKFKKSSSPEVQISWQAIGNGTILIVCWNNISSFFEMFEDIIHEFSADNFVLFALEVGITRLSLI